MQGEALLWLPDVLRAAGLQVVLQDGWESRSRSSGGFVDGKPFAVFWHHTASKTSPENDASYMSYGSDSRPIANLMVTREGVVWVLAAGATNTNGKGKALNFSRGTVPLDSANSSVIGMECCNNGVGEVWPQAQIDAMFAASNAVNAHLGNTARDAATHAHYAPDRKIDPATADGVQGVWRPTDINSSGTWENGDVINECEARGGQMPPPQPPPTTDTVFGPDVSKWQQGLIPPEDHGIHFVEARASKGTLRDSAALLAADWCWPRGIPFAAYHFVYPTAGHLAIDQADAFSESVGGNREICCMLDWEEDSDDECHPPGNSQHPEWEDVLEVKAAIEALGYRVTLVYTGHWYWEKTGKPDMSGAGLALINSNYGPKPKPEGDAATVYAATGGDDSPGWEPFGGLTPTFLQFSDQVTWGNKQLDMNAFKGDPAELGQWFTTWTGIPEPPPEPEPEPTPPPEPEPEPTPPPTPEPGPPAPPLTEDDKSMVVALDNNGTAWIGDGMTRYTPTEDDFNVKVLLAGDDCFRFVNTQGERVQGWQNVHTVGDNVIEALGLRI